MSLPQIWVCMLQKNNIGDISFVVLQFQSLLKCPEDLQCIQRHRERASQREINTDMQIKPARLQYWKNKVAHSTGMICSLFSRELVYWGTMAEGENGISSLLIMDHNQLQDYRENCVLIESQQMYVNCFSAIFFLFLFFLGGAGWDQTIKSYFEIGAGVLTWLCFPCYLQIKPCISLFIPLSEALSYITDRHCRRRSARLCRQGGQLPDHWAASVWADYADLSEGGCWPTSSPDLGCLNC